MRISHTFIVTGGDEYFPVRGVVQMSILMMEGRVLDCRWFMEFEGERIKPVWVTKERIELEKQNAIYSRRK